MYLSVSQSESNLQELALFHQMGPGGVTQVVRYGSKRPYPLSGPTSPCLLVLRWSPKIYIAQAGPQLLLHLPQPLNVGVTGVQQHTGPVSFGLSTVKTFTSAPQKEACFHQDPLPSLLCSKASCGPFSSKHCLSWTVHTNAVTQAGCWLMPVVPTQEAQEGKVSLGYMISCL